MTRRFELAIFECEHCGCRTTEPETDGYLGDYCPECGSEAKIIDSRSARWVSIAIYDTWRDYGGPEEGGWYFDTGVIDMSPDCIDKLRVFSDLNKAEAYIDELNTGLKHDSHKVKWFLEEMPPKYFPITRPRYC